MLDEKKASAVLDAAAAFDRRPGHAALRAFEPALREIAASLDHERVAALRSADEPRLFLAQRDNGPVLALRSYAPDERSTVHSHAWTVLFGLEGGGSLERWTDEAGGARLVDVEQTVVGRASVIDGDEPHRQGHRGTARSS